MNNPILKLLVLMGVTVLIAVGIISFAQIPQDHHNPEIITTNFITYDFARAITKEPNKIKMLLPPASEVHNFEPTPEDIQTIENADLFIYIGGESDEWVETLLQNNEIPTEKTLKLIDYVELIPEESHDHESHTSKEPEYDEHIWTSLPNSIKLIEAITAKLVNLYPTRSEAYTKNSADFTSSLKTIDQDFRNIIATANKRELVFADRFPFLYFTKEYGLDHYSAFSGCSEQTEADPATIANLVEHIKKHHLSTILKIELSSDKLAKAIAEETNTKIMTFSAGHNVSQADFDKGITYLDILEQNKNVLREALK